MSDIIPFPHFLLIELRYLSELQRLKTIVRERIVGLTTGIIWFHLHTNIH